MSWACDGTSTAPTGINGTVTDEDAQPIAGATVTLSPTGTTATTGSDGRYNLALPSTLPPYATVSYAAAGYSSVSRAFLQLTSSMQLLPVELRRATIMAVTVPAAGQPAVTVSNPVSDGGVTLRIEAGDLVDDANTAVTGNANVEITYWHPKSTLSSIPSLLAAAPGGNTTVPLQTFGMVNLAADQNGKQLSIATGSTIEAEFSIPATQMAQISTSGLVPNLYYLDPNIGIWVGAARPGNANVSRVATRDNYGPFEQWPGYAVQPYSSSNVTVVYDPNTGKYTTTLPYFAAWNVDGELPPDDGGCVTGKVINACNPSTGFVGEPVTFWALGFEQLRDFHAVTDSASNYCVNIGISPYQATNNGDPEDTYNYTLNYFVSGASIDDTSECDPLPPDCRTCNASYEGLASPFCNLCQLQYPGDSPFHDPTLPPPQQYADTCTPPTSKVNLNACHFCPGTAPASCTMPNTFDSSGHLYANGTTHAGCAQLDPIVLRPPSCTCQYRGAVCTNSGCCAGADGKQSVCNGVGVCVACTKFINEICTQTDGCCDPTGKTQLTCADNVCVPANDPTFSE